MCFLGFYEYTQQIKHGGEILWDMDWEDMQSPMCDVWGSNMGTQSLGGVILEEG